MVFTKMVKSSSDGFLFFITLKSRTTLFFLSLIALISLQPALAQEKAFIESNGLVVIQAESVDPVGDWVVESSDPNYTGSGYLRWDGPDQYGSPGNGTLAYPVLITTPGEYNIRLRISHLGAPAGDQWNDVWAQVDGSTWVKTLHPAGRKDEGFTFHSPTEPSSGVFSQLRFNLTAGVHTLYISGRSTNLRMDRIHFYKDGVPNPENLALAESPFSDVPEEEEEEITIDPPANPVISGDLKKWHPITLTFDGPAVSETDSLNPFLDYRLEVTFSQNDHQVTVPGYFAADGDAANTSSNSGNKWRAHFVPDTTGTWSYEISMRTGNQIAIDINPLAGEAGLHDGLTGAFSVEETDKAGRDHRGKGILRYVDGHYLQFDNGEYFLKGGANSPENLLAYQDFDSTYSVNHTDFTKTYTDHITDWRIGDPTWQDGKGKGLIGAMNYLSAEGMNVSYFLTMNVEGDAQDVWPWIGPEDRLRYDVSKLAQWDIIFSHMDSVGIMMHVVLQETENERLLDNGALGIERKLYFRELIARFGYHHALTWNLGEENDENTDAQRKEFAGFIRSLDPYDHPIVIHTYPGQDDDVYEPLLGFEDFEGPSLQLHGMENTYDATRLWRDLSAANGRPWIVSMDEFGPFQVGVTEEGPDSNHDDVRKHALWANLMAGGAGVEWYFGYETGSHDLNTENWRTRGTMWDYTRQALTFFQEHLPFHQMNPVDDVAISEDVYVFADANQLYAIYAHRADSVLINLPYGEYAIAWYNPRTGGALQTGDVTTITGPGRRLLQAPAPDADLDWVALLTNTGNEPVLPALSVATSVLDFGAVNTDTTHVLPLSISNIGNAPLVIDSLYLAGKNAEFFSLPDESALTIEAGGSFDFEIAFRADSLVVDSLFADSLVVNSLSAILHFASNDLYSELMAVSLSANIDTLAQDEAHPLSVVNFVLVDADTDQEIASIVEGDSLDLSLLPPHLNVRADVGTAAGQSVSHVYFNLTPTNAERKESVAPYVLFGDVGGNYLAGTFNPGENVLTATPFGLDGDTNEAGKPLVVTFQVTGFNAGTTVSAKSGITQEQSDPDASTEVDQETPAAFSLEANYPNPFNPTTSITFTLQQSGQVKLAVFDMLGRQVKVLVDGQIQAGRQEVMFDAAGLPSGTYIYRMEANGLSITRKMLLVK